MCCLHVVTCGGGMREQQQHMSHSFRSVEQGTDIVEITNTYFCSYYSHLQVLRKRSNEH
jgi:hypothetical protein